MPLEADNTTRHLRPATIGRAFVTDSCLALETSLRKIEHCLAQLSEADIQWRAHESHNSIQNIILHLCGNLRQWILHGVSGAPDERNRALEFSDRRPLPKDELLRRLRDTVAGAIKALAAIPDGRLLEVRRIQGFEVSLHAAIFDSVSHFVGHTHQIVYITRLRLGDSYRFQWAPATPEQGAP